MGRALGLNPFAPVVPCHRVLAAGDRPGGFSAGGGALTKVRMLRIEGAARVVRPRCLIAGDGLHDALRPVMARPRTV